MIHGGDILYRSRVPAELVHRAFAPLKEIAALGIPVYVVPGNHERSRIPFGLLAQHENVFLFDRPKTYVHARKSFRLALAGFPYERSVGQSFPRVVESTAWRNARADATLLLIHHAVQGARVHRHTFTEGEDVVRTADIPPGITAVLSGHIHRAQVLTRHLNGQPLHAPVLYPGSVERTSFAEKNERKRYLTLAVRHDGRLQGWRFHELPARPMAQVRLAARELARDDLDVWLHARLASLPPDAVVQLRVEGEVPKALGAASLRALAPTTMNISLSVQGWR